jgi:catechol 2,3-dioxygenase-like lactoylglutathione lyase family enzyme
MGLSKVSNIILSVSSLEKSLAFYRDVLGMKVNSTIPGEFVFLDGGGTVVALRERSESASPGLTEVVFEVPDIYAAYESLRTRGVVFSHPPTVVTESNGRRLVATDFRDPDEHILSITSWLSKK